MFIDDLCRQEIRVSYKSLTRRELLKLIAAAGVCGQYGFAPLLFAASAAPIFEDIRQLAGIEWEHFSGASEDRFLIETMGSGVAFTDYDNDGFLDIFFVNGGETRRGKSSQPVRNALYRNLRNGHFEDVTERAGVGQIPFYGTGVAAADYDNDGFQDLFISGYPRSALFHNNGDGTFSDVTEKAGLLNLGKWGTSAAWFDYDRDGLLDLFVCNYVQFSFSDVKQCEMAGRRGYCEQLAYQGDSPTLYHNNGDGTFTDVTERAGLQALRGRALGVVAVDANDDGWTDLFVARDASPNLLLVNQKDGTFKDVGAEAGIAYSSLGKERAGMGVDAADINGDGLPDFVVTNFTDEFHALFVSTSPLEYADRGMQSGLAQLTRLDVGFGTHFLDYDNDGNVDLIIANGHVTDLMEIARADAKYRELPLLLRNTGAGSFKNMKDSGGPFFATPCVARGLAVGDFNNDGFTDIAVSCLNTKPVLLENKLAQQMHWIGLALEGTKSNRDAIGAKAILRSGDRHAVRWVTGGSSYLSSSDKRVVFGLGPKTDSKVSVEIRWPTGFSQILSDLEIDRYHKIREPYTGGA
jgi:enediyne biosynthesis protein E4